MNSKGHLIISLVKSVLRMSGALIGLIFQNITIFLVIFMAAEVLGIAEEGVDKR